MFCPSQFYYNLTFGLVLISVNSLFFLSTVFQKTLFNTDVDS